MKRPTDHDFKLMRTFLSHDGVLPKEFAKSLMPHLEAKGYLRTVILPEPQTMMVCHLNAKARHYNDITECWALTEKAERATRTMAITMPLRNGAKFSEKEIAYRAVELKAGTATPEWKEQVTNWCLKNDVVATALCTPWRKPQQISVEEEHVILFMMRWL